MKHTIFIYALAMIIASQTASALDIGAAVKKRILVMPDRETVELSNEALDDLDPKTMDVQHDYYAQRKFDSKGGKYPMLTFTDWQKKYADEAALLTLFPGFKEQMILVKKTNSKELEELVVIESRAKNLIAKPASQIDLKKTIDLDFINRMDKTIHNRKIDGPEQAITAITDRSHVFKWCNDESAFVDDAVRGPTREKNLVSITNQAHPWCQNDGHSTCVESCYYFTLLQQGLITGYNESWGRNEPPKDLAQAMQTEGRYFVDPSEIGTNESALKALTHINGRVAGGLVQTTFYANQGAKWTKTLSVIQEDPSDPSRTRTVMTTINTFVTKRETWEKAGGEVGKALRGELVPGNTHTCTLTDGVPRFFQCTISRVANAL